MSENDPQEVARQALKNQPEGEDQLPPPAANGSNPLPIVLGVGALALLLIAAGLFMLFGGRSSTDTPSAAAPETGEQVTAEETLAVVRTADLATLPAGLTPKGEVVVLSNGTAVSVPGGVQAIDDLYVWNGEQWVFVPSVISGDGQQLQITGQTPGQEGVIVERAKPDSIIIGSEVGQDEPMPTDYLPLLNEISVGSLRLAADGKLEGDASAMPTGGYMQYLHVTNSGVIVDQTALSQLLGDPTLQAAHIDALVTRAATDGYAGINLDYQGVVAGQAAEFTTFVENLAGALQARDLKLVVTLATPVAGENGQWDTGGQNWEAIGRAADGVYAQMPLDPSAYVDGGPAEKMLSWGARQINRATFTALFSANAIDKLGGVLREMPLSEALEKVGSLEFVEPAESVDPGAPVAVSLAGNATPLEWDGDSLTYKFTYDENGQTRTVWLNSDAALAYRLRLADRYRVRGVVVRGLAGAANPERYVSALESYSAGAAAPDPVGAAITWTVENADGGVVASSSGEALNFTWEGTESAGTYRINAGFALGDTVRELGSLEVLVGTPEPEVAADPEPEPEPEGEEVTATGSTNATVNVGSNIRTGPGVIYGIITGADPGTRVEVVGRSSDSLWLNIVLPDATNGWIFNSLLDLDETVNVAGLPVSKVSASPVAAAAGGGGQPSAPAAPAPVAPANLGGGFELGGQTHSLANPTLMQYAGMKWVKFQHKWGCGNQPGDVAGRINQAHANGFKVLLSIPGSPYPSSIDFDCYVKFLGGVAALGPDAIEVWNEMNIDFEWPAGQINPASYVNNMLAPAYNAIKSANRNVIVVSGAPAPTGFFGGGCSTNGCDDNAYLAGMAAAGAASYMDCMGVHFNAGATPPSQSSGHPAGGTHYSWYFQPMLNTYFNALGKPLCITELGYLSGQDYGGVPSRFSWAGNTTVAQHAQWLAEAISLSANSGKVRMAIVFNVDFTLYSDDPQAGYAMVRKDGSCPACETLRRVMGGG